MFKKILIANRGEIAVRILRACREMSIPAVVVFSEADRASLHVRMADEAYPIGPAPSRESYLVIDKILGVARTASCDALHPGYGFLAENPNLARACAAAGITFIGPSAEAMERLGSKTAAWQRARAAGEKACVWSSVRANWRRPGATRRQKQPMRSATGECISKNSWFVRAMWKFKSSAMLTATSFISANANAPCSAAIRK